MRAKLTSTAANNLVSTYTLYVDIGGRVFSRTMEMTKDTSYRNTPESTIRNTLLNQILSDIGAAVRAELGS